MSAKLIVYKIELPGGAPETKKITGLNRESQANILSRTAFECPHCLQDSELLDPAPEPGELVEPALHTELEPECSDPVSDAETAVFDDEDNISEMMATIEAGGGFEAQDTDLTMVDSNNTDLEETMFMEALQVHRLMNFAVCLVRLMREP